MIRVTCLAAPSEPLDRGHSAARHAAHSLVTERTRLLRCRWMRLCMPVLEPVTLSRNRTSSPGSRSVSGPESRADRRRAGDECVVRGAAAVARIVRSPAHSRWRLASLSGSWGCVRARAILLDKSDRSFGNRALITKPTKEGETHPAQDHPRHRGCRHATHPLRRSGDHVRRRHRRQGDRQRDLGLPPRPGHRNRSRAGRSTQPST